MKTLVIIYAGSVFTHAFEQRFAGKSAFERVLSWASGINNSAGIIVLTTKKNRITVDTQQTGTVTVIEEEDWTNARIASAIADACTKMAADSALYVWGDCPFLNDAITDEIIDTHTKYLAEYTFADGYPYGLAPEMIDAGAASIIAQLAVTVQSKAGNIPAARDALFSIMKGDINSFEIETVISEKDYRMLRLELACGSKAGLIACEHLFSACKGKMENAVSISDCAETSADVLQTVPAFYSLQISGSCAGNCSFCPFSFKKDLAVVQDMPFLSFKKLIAQIAALSERAVVSISAWGEPLLYPEFVAAVKEILSYPQLSVLIETDGTLVTAGLAEETASFGEGRIDWIVSLDAIDAKQYASLHGRQEADFDKAVSAVVTLEKSFPHRVFPQFVRMKENEVSLEPFYRFWKEPASPSAGELIIQKYDSFCGLLPDRKSADLSPLERNPCWHIRRDMTIFADGTVPFCHECAPLFKVMEGIDVVKGNVFNESLETVWERFRSPVNDHIEHHYSKMCQGCDEYYTFNF